MRTAIIDIGTNTINLLIADIREDKTYNIILETAYPAKLGKGGINSKKILPDALERGMTALRTHLNTIKSFSVNKTVCVATSAMRDATNSIDFITKVKHELNIDINIVNGQKEAQLIFDGVKQVVPIGEKPVMILDIGGGSNEFIIANSNGIVWKHSFNLGVARLLDMFKPNDPMTSNEIKTVEQYIRKELRILFDITRQHKVDTLIGASGSFDTVATMIAAIHHPQFDITQASTYPISPPFFNELHQRVLKSNYKERLKMNGIVIHRVDTIVLATIFINFIIREFSIQELWQCSFALKEGSVYQIINNKL